MKSSIFLAATSAVLALANPLDKRVLETEVVTAYYTVTVTGAAPQATPTHVKVRPQPQPTQEESPVEQPETTTVPETTVSEPTTTSQPVVIVTVTPEESKPTTTVQTSASKPSTVVDTPAQASDQASSEGDSFESVAVYHHNIHRSNHSSPEVTWNDKIAGYAANTAATCKFAHDMYAIIIPRLVLVPADI